MSTQVKVESNETPVVDPQAEGLTEAQLEEYTKLMADTTIQADPNLQTKIGAVDNVEAKLGGKWVVVAEYVISKEWAPLSEAENDKPSKERAAELKHGKQVILRTLLAMNKTYKSAQSIRTFIMKVARYDAAELRAKMKTGEATVREAREWGRKPQSNPSVKRDDTTRYAEAINNVVWFGRQQGFDTTKIYSDISAKYFEMEQKQNASLNKGADEGKAAAKKAEFKAALEETRKQVESKS